MKRIIVSLILVAGVFLTGCIETQLLVTVRKDGSGTIRETIRMKKAMGEMFAAMATDMKTGMEESGFEVDESETPPASTGFDMFSEEKIIKDANRMGGVRYESHEMIDTDEHAGYVAVYAFDDVNAVRVDQDPAASLPDMPGTEQVDEQNEERVTFRFTPGNPAQLVIVSPSQEEGDAEGFEEDTEPAGEDDGEGDDDGSMEQMKEFFRDMRLLIQVAVEGGITGTNATFVEGSTITMMDIDFNVLIDDPELLKQLQKVETMGPAAGKELMKNIPGLRVETEEEISVSFR
jgi:hypothetical protein